MEEELTIGEVARRAGVRASALRYYESVGLLTAARRVNGRRRYGPDALNMLAVIRLAQQAGFSMAEIQTLLHGFGEETQPVERWRPLAEHKLDELDKLIARAQRMQRILRHLLECDCASLADCGIAEQNEQATRRGVQTPEPPVGRS